MMFPMSKMIHYYKSKEDEELPLLNEVFSTPREMFYFEYPFNEVRNTVLEDKIYNKYKNRRICVINVDDFKELL